MQPVPKPKRIKDEELLRQVRKFGCCVKDCERPAEAAHIKSKGSGGDDVPENLSPLCYWHHELEQHIIGWERFKKRHPEVMTWAEICGRKLA